MVVLLILLIVSHGTTGYFLQWDTTQLSWPAKCLFSPAGVSKMADASDGGLPQYNIPYVAFSIAFLVISYLTRVIRIFNRTARLAKKSLKAGPRKHLRRWYIWVEKQAKLDQPRALKAFWNAITLELAVLYIILKALYDIGESLLWEVYWTSSSSSFCSQKTNCVFRSPGLWQLLLGGA